jgi:hypothetical protein
MGRDEAPNEVSLDVYMGFSNTMLHSRDFHRLFVRQPHCTVPSPCSPAKLEPSRSVSEKSLNFW